MKYLVTFIWFYIQNVVFKLCLVVIPPIVVAFSMLHFKPFNSVLVFPVLSFSFLQSLQ